MQLALSPRFGQKRFAGGGAGSEVYLLLVGSWRGSLENSDGLTWKLGGLQLARGETAASRSGVSSAPGCVVPALVLKPGCLGRPAESAPPLHSHGALPRRLWGPVPTPVDRRIPKAARLCHLDLSGPPRGRPALG